MRKNIGDAQRSGRPGRITVRRIDERTRWEHLDSSPYATFQQTQDRGRARSDARAVQDLGRFDAEGGCLGAAGARYRRFPGTPWWVARIPDGPVVNRELADLDEILHALVEHLRDARVLAVRIVPRLMACSGEPETVKHEMADESIASLDEVIPDSVSAGAHRIGKLLERLRWTRLPHEGPFDVDQARCSVHLPSAGKTEESIRSAMNWTWRRNICADDRRNFPIRRQVAQR